MDGIGCQRGECVDIDEFWRLYDEGLPVVYRYLLRRCGDRTVAEDLTQDVFLAAARTVRRGDRVITIGWLLTVARTKLVDHYRREHRARRNLQVAWSTRGRDEEATVAADCADAELGPVAGAALDALPPLQRAALVLHHVDDLAVAEVASMIGRSVRATESLLARARRGFRSTFEEIAGA